MNDEQKIRAIALQAAVRATRSEEIEQNVLTQEIDGLICRADGRVHEILRFAEDFENFIDTGDTGEPDWCPLTTDGLPEPMRGHLLRNYGEVRDGKRVPS